MKQFFISALLFLTLMSQTRAQEIKILTYNIFHGENPTQSGHANFQEIANLIIQMQPEVIALQEVDSLTERVEKIYGQPIDLIQKFARETGYDGYFGKAMDYNGGGYGEGLLVKKGSNFHTILLPTPQGGEPRAAAFAKVELKTQEKFYLGGTHLCHQFEGNRLAQVDSLFAYAEELDQPVILAGDFNFTPDSPEYSQIPGHWKEAGAESGTSQNTYGTVASGARIDYIWYDSRKFELVEYKVLEAPHSDHYPVWAILRMKKEKL